jgi:hypothetical protein
MSNKINKSAVCVGKCTYGKPPKFYQPGDPMIFLGDPEVVDGSDCPAHFRLKRQAAPKAAAPASDDDTGKVLSQVGASDTTAQEQSDRMTGSEPCTVKQLAKELDKDPQLVKEAAGKPRLDDKLTGAEVDAVKAAFAKQQAEPAPHGGDSSAANSEAPGE